MKPAKRLSTTMDEQTFVPDTMRALYWCPASTALRDNTSLEHPRVDSEVVFDTNFPTPKPSPWQYLIKVQMAAFSHEELRLEKALNPSKSIPQVPVHNFCGTIISTPTKDHEKPDGPKFKVDEVVFGLIDYSQDGAAADYVLATEDEIAQKPKNISAAEAATIPLPVLTAWQALFKYAAIDPSKTNAIGRGSLRVLITNPLPSEVGIQALQLLRSQTLFNRYRPWICATCTSEDAVATLRNKYSVDETVITPGSVPEDYDLNSVFRNNKWDPVDVVLDCTGENLFVKANNPTIVKNGGHVLTAVDANPVLDVNPTTELNENSKKGGPVPKFVSVEPDGETLALIVKMVEENTIRGRVGSIIDLVDGADCLKSDAACGGRQGGIHVFRVNPS